MGTTRVDRTRAAVRVPRWRQLIAALVVLVLGLAATAFLVVVSYQTVQDQSRKVADQQAARVAERVVSTLTPMDSVTQATRAFLLSTPDGPASDRVEQFLQRLYQRWSGFRALAAAPDNVVTVVVPEAGNEALVGLRYRDNPEQWVDVERAMRTRESVLSGPVELVQGGRGFVYRTPVFREDGTYWGTVSASIESGPLLHADERNVDIADPSDPTVPIVGVDVDPTGEHVSRDATVLGRSFTVVAALTTPDHTGTVIVLVAGILTSVLLSVLVYLLAGAVARERAVARLVTDLVAQAPGVLLQMRQPPGDAPAITYASMGLDRMLENAGAEPPPPGGEQDALTRLVHPDDLERVAQAQDASARTGEPWHQRFRVRYGDGSVRWLLMDAQPRRESSGDVVWHGWVGDVTDDVAGEEALRVSASLFEVSRDGVVILDDDGRVDDANAGFTAMTGYAADDVRGRHFSDYTRGHLADEVLAEIWSQLSTYGYWRGEVTGRAKDGHIRTDAATATAVRDESGRLSHYVVVLDNMDITRDDSVTGLPHARTLSAQVAAAVDGADRSGEQVAVIVLGLDQFRKVNAAYGHRVGDAVLRALAQRLRAVVPPGGVVVRLRGDEFAILLPGVRDVIEVDATLRAALDAVAKPVSVGRHVIRLTSAAGVSVYPGESVDPAHLVSSANQAMSAAKADGPNQARYVTADMLTAARDRVALVDDLGAALRRLREAGPGGGTGELSIALQPVVSLADMTARRAEALVRWTHPERGPVPPDVFIPLAEQAGLVTELGDVVFAEVVRALGQVNGVDSGFCIAVNLSPLELREDLGRHADRLESLQRAGLGADRLIAEITEGTLLSHDPTIDANIALYREAGVRFAIDDFGTGYSSLSYLMELDVQFLKIDRTFVDGLAPGSDGLALCEAIIAMARTMGIQVIAEGVETAMQEHLLARAGCDFVQGFRHSQPLPVDGLIGWLRRRPDPTGEA